MSAFVCSEYHISYIVQAGINYKAWVNLGNGFDYLKTDKAQHVYEILTRENMRSVNYRYKDSRAEIKESISNEIGFRKYVASVEPVQAIKAVHCLEYQSCEHPQWESSLAYRICQAVKEAAVRELPGYESASWEVSKDKVSH